MPRCPPLRFAALAALLAVGVLLCAVPAAAQSAGVPSPLGLRAAVLYGAPLRLVPDKARRASPLQVPRPNRGVALSPPPVHADTLRDPWIGRDKLIHASASFLLTLSSQYVLTAKLDTDDDTALPIAIGTALSFGLAKEFADSRRPVRPLFSVRDLTADAVGVALGAALILL